MCGRLPALLSKRLTALNTLVIIGLFAAMADAQDRGRGAPPAAGQAPAGRGRAAGPGYLKLFDSNMPFEPRDLAGIWTPNGNGFGGGGRCRDCGDRGYSFEFPEFTPAGQAAFDKQHSVVRPHEGQCRRARPIPRSTSDGGAPSRRRSATTPTARAIPWECRAPPLPGSGGVHRAARPHLSALPVGLRPAHDLDGRPDAPGPDDVDIPRWWGYASGRWEATRWWSTPPGYDERTWIDHFGYPHSDRWCCRSATPAPTTTRWN